MTATIRRWSGAVAFSAILLAGCQSAPTSPLAERFQPKVATRILPVTPDRIVVEADYTGYTCLLISDIERQWWADFCNRKLDEICGDNELLIGPSRADGAQATQEVEFLEIRLGEPPPVIQFMFIPEGIVPEFVFIGLVLNTHRKLGFHAELRIAGRSAWTCSVGRPFGRFASFGVIPFPLYEDDDWPMDDAFEYQLKDCLTILFTGKSLGDWYHPPLIEPPSRRQPAVAPERRSMDHRSPDTETRTP